jgi:type I restriction enzyme, S subunit
MNRIDTITTTIKDIVSEDKQIVIPNTPESKNLPYIGLENIEAQTGKILGYETDSVQIKSNTFAFNNDHVLFGKLRPYLKKIALPDQAGRCSTEIIPLLPNDVDRGYLAFLLRTQKIIDAVMSEKTGSRMPRANMKIFFNIEISIPKSIEKQRRIVAQLKAQLAEVEKAHQAVKAQLQDSQTLKSAILKETFTNHESKKWPSITLGEAGNVVAGITLGRKVNGKATRSIPYLRVANVKDGHLDLSDVKKIEATDAEIERLLLKPGDILLTEGGDPDKLGRGTFWSGELDECIHQNHIFRVRFPQDSYLPEFIAAQIGSSYGKGYFFSHAKQTTGIATINQTILKNFPVLSPPIETQKTVMAALTSQLDEVEKMIVSIKKQLHEINQLPQKILAQAFEIDP